jgi:hypothetical protein
MSYVNMDHAGWVESNNQAHNRMAKDRRGFKPAPETLNPIQVKAVSILGIALGGIYNAPISWEKTDWSYGWGAVAFIVRDDRFATFDFAPLTTMVLLCHEARVRMMIEAHTHGYMKVSFSQRAAEGGMATRHPNITEAVDAFREYFPADHHLNYDPERDIVRR